MGNLLDFPPFRWLFRDAHAVVVVAKFGSVRVLGVSFAVADGITTVVQYVDYFP